VFKLISVAIPTYKRANYLKLGLQSIFSQTLLPDEVVVSQDGTDVETREVIQSFMNRHPAVKVKHSVNETPLGERANRERAFKLTSGDFVTMLDDDDMWHPDFLQKAYDALLKNPDCGYCFGSYLLIDARGKPLERMTQEVDDYCGRSRIPPGKCDNALYRILANVALPIPLSCTLFRRAELEKIDFVPPYGPVLPDLALFLELGVQRTSGFYIPERLGWYRVHDGQTTTWRIQNSISKVDCFHEIDRKYAAVLDKAEAELLKRRFQSAIVECAISHVHYRKRKEAIAYLFRFFKLGFGLPSLQRIVVLMALFVGIRNRALSLFRNTTPQLEYNEK
jgi:glycosyltransferase involved in cell wall biosynthesis